MSTSAKAIILIGVLCTGLSCSKAERSNSSETQGGVNPPWPEGTLEVSAFKLFPSRVDANGQILSLSGADIDTTVAHAFDGLVLTTTAALRFINSDGSQSTLPSPPVENGFMRSSQRIVDIALYSDSDYSANLAVGSDLAPIIELQPMYKQFDGAPFALMPDGSFVNFGDNPFESADEIVARPTEMPHSIAVRFKIAPAITSVHTFTFFVTLDDGQQLEVVWPALRLQ